MLFIIKKMEVVHYGTNKKKKFNYLEARSMYRVKWDIRIKKQRTFANWLSCMF